MLAAIVVWDFRRIAVLYNLVPQHDLCLVYEKYAHMNGLSESALCVIKLQASVRSTDMMVSAIKKKGGGDSKFVIFFHQKLQRLSQSAHFKFT